MLDCSLMMHHCSSSIQYPVSSIRADYIMQRESISSTMTQIGEATMSTKRIFHSIFVSMFAVSFTFALAQDGANGVKKETEAKGAKIQFQEASFDFGTVAQGSAVKHVFKFKNVGTDTLRIEQVKTSCGCTAAESSKIIPPQQDGQITVTYNTGSALGKASKTVSVYSNDIDDKPIIVTLHGVIEAKKETAKSQK
jgi:hypothetical protein